MLIPNRGTAPRGIRLAAVLVVVVLAAAVAASVAGSHRLAPHLNARVPHELAAAAEARPAGTFRVILEGSSRSGAAHAAAVVRRAGAASVRPLTLIHGAAAVVTGRQLIALARTKGVKEISPDTPVRLLDNGNDDGDYWSSQQWPYDVHVQRDWTKSDNNKIDPPAIAIVDSGIQANRADFGFGSQVIASTTIVNTGTPNSPGDGYGHGTFVAGIADGSADGYAGTSPAAPVVSIDVLDDNGMGLTSDVIAACGWIVAHKAQYNIRVANFSLTSTAPASVFWDPLDQAVEQLWFDGVTVVAAAGNYGTGNGPSGVLYAPGNDPFVITVGADDTGGTVGTRNDKAAPWSAYGYTYDGFAKPEVAAPGRYMIGPVPDGSTLESEFPNNVEGSNPGYIQLSGTSFATPVVSGTAAYLLALNPKWTPDQVKGAIMLSANPEPNAAPLSVGVGLVDVTAAGQVNNPPNPNAALDKFVQPVPGSLIPVFNTAAWQAAALKNPNWDQSTWNNASWGSASWGSASWGSASWGSASWGSASWGSASWGSSSLAQSLAQSQASWGSAANGAAANADVAHDKPLLTPGTIRR